MIEKISVVIITRNREKMLEDCLESIVKQTRLPDEVIVIDNASTDDTKKLVLSFKKILPLRYVLEKQIGIPYARNKGIQEASGTLLLMLDDDCEAGKFWVEKMEKAHKKYPKAWVIQGRTNSLPKERLYSPLAEFNRFLSLRNYAKTKISLTGLTKLLSRVKKFKILPLRANYIKTLKSSLRINGFFNKDFREEIATFTCDTKNFSIKTSYLKKYKLLFDEHFYRGSDSDLGKQIVQKNGLIIFCPNILVFHWERPTLAEFLKQRWHIGRTAARISDKWKMPAARNINPPVKKLLTFLLFCKVFNQLHKLPILTSLLFLDRLYYLNGYFFEKRVLSLAKH